MKKFFLLLFATSSISIFISCKKNSTDAGSSTTAKITFTNNKSVNYRLILTNTVDTTYPYNNSILDVDVPGNSSVVKDVIPGKRKMVGLYPCYPAGQTLAGCTTLVYKTVEYVANQNYTQIIQ